MPDASQQRPVNAQQAPALARAIYRTVLATILLFPPRFGQKVVRIGAEQGDLKAALSSPTLSDPTHEGWVVGVLRPPALVLGLTSPLGRYSQYVAGARLRLSAQDIRTEIRTGTLPYGGRRVRGAARGGMMGGSS